MKRLVRTSLGALLLGVLLLGLAATAVWSPAIARSAAGPGSRLVVASKVFGRRYCELFLVHKLTTGFAADVFNTYGLNKCPSAQWTAIDTGAVAKANHALVVVRNGPRYWAMDEIEKYRQGHEVIKNLGGLRMIQEAVLSLGSLSAKPYTVHRVNRTTIFVWNKGRRIYELHRPDGSTWVMQAWSQQIDPTMGPKALPGLAKRLALPAGWTYTSRKLTKPLRVVTVKTDAQVLQDDFDNSYSHVTGVR